jgi:hypothetical protein
MSSAMQSVLKLIRSKIPDLKFDPRPKFVSETFLI